MRTRTMLAMVGLLAVPALAWAEGGSSDPSQQQEPGLMGGDVSLGEEQRTAMPGSGSQLDPQQQRQIFQSRESFNLEGTVASVDQNQNKITVNRPNLPPAELTTSNQTKVEIDGRQASLSQIRPGTEIRAKFNLAQDQAVATEVKAHSRRSGQSGQQSR